MCALCDCVVQDAEMAIASMNGQWIGGRAIRTNWANGKANANATRGSDNRQSCESITFYSDPVVRTLDSQLSVTGSNPGLG